MVKNKAKTIFYILLLCLVSLLLVILGNKTTFFDNILSSKTYNAPVNDYFNDDNLYKCIIDNYNTINNLTVDYTYNLSDEELATITTLSCSGLEKEETDKILDATGINKLTALLSVDLSNNKLTEIDLSGNISLTTINLSNNLFSQDRTIYISDTINGSALTPTSVVLPVEFVNAFTNVTTTDEDLTINENIVEATAGGEHSFSYNTNSYSVIYNLTVVALTSSNYIIDNETNTIYVKETVTNSVLLGNLSINYGSLEINDGKVQVIINEEILKEYTVEYINIASSYNLTNDYIYIGTDDFDINEIAISNGTLNVTVDNVLQIKHGEKVLWEYDIVHMESSTYDLSKTYIYLAQNTFDESKLTVTNGTLFINSENVLEIKHGETVLASYDLIKINTEFIISDGYIFLGSLNLDVSDEEMISASNASLSVNEDKELKVTYDNEIIASYALIKINSPYDWHNGYVYVGTNTFDLDEVTIENATISVNVSSNIDITFGETTISTFTVVGINLGDLNVSNKLITLLEPTTYDDFMAEVTTVGAKAEVYTTEEEPILITTGNIESGMILNIKKAGVLLDSYAITDSYINIPGLNVTNNQIYNVNENTTVAALKEIIATSGTLSITDKDDIVLENTALVGTGTKAKITLGERNYEYTIVVTGDVNGDGAIDSLDAYRIIMAVVNISSLSGVYAEAGLTTSSDELSTIDAYNVMLHSLDKKERFER